MTAMMPPPQPQSSGWVSPHPDNHRNDFLPAQDMKPR
jgi:hypothetical protein